MNPRQINQMPEPKSAVLPVPRELRDCIYEYLLTSTFSVKNPETGGETALSLLPLHRNARLAILGVSWSTYDEAKRVLYRHGHFRFDVVAADSPPLRKEILGIPAIEMLQDITIRLDASVAKSLGYNEFEIVEYAITLIKYFAGLDSNVPRNCCVIETVSISPMEFFGPCACALLGFRDAVSRLTGFKTVELKIWYSQRSAVFADAANFLSRLFTSPDGSLVVGLGDGERVFEQEHVRCIFHPQRGRTWAAVSRHALPI